MVEAETKTRKDSLILCSSTGVPAPPIIGMPMPGMPGMPGFIVGTCHKVQEAADMQSWNAISAVPCNGDGAPAASFRCWTLRTYL